MKLKECLRKYPIPSCIGVALLSFLLLGGIGLIRKLLPESILIDYLRQIINILWPLGLAVVLGYGWIYKTGSFPKTLLVGIFALILFSFTFLVRASEAILNDETSWKSLAGILLGVINIFGVGFREESIFRGVIANNLGIAYGKDVHGVWKAVIISGLIFGLAHLTNIIFGVEPLKALIQTVSACAIGIYLSVVYFRGGNIWALILIHCITDAGGLFRSAFTTQASNVTDINNLSLNGLIMVPIYLGIAVFLLRSKKIDSVIDNLKHNTKCDQ